jgi:hypothetical protein
MGKDDQDLMLGFLSAGLYTAITGMVSPRPATTALRVHFQSFFIFSF